MQYRADIDGLRAVAVTTVVAFHVGLPGFGAGFVGVDVFFVISGFLITSLLLAEQDRAGRIDLTAFYARRVRRLVPALGLVLAAAIAAGFFLLSAAGEQQEAAKSAASASVFLSNVYFGFTRLGYFAGPAQYLPLLHTWSLGIEEQFYLVWPPVLIFLGWLAVRLRRPDRAVMTAVLGAASALSLILCLALIDRAESIAFFSFPTRAWELGAGALLSLAPLKAGPRPRAGLALALFGAAIIAGVTVFYPADSMFTGIPSLLAVAGTVMLLAGGQLAPGSAATRLLSGPAIVAIGKLSYAWYLWHWPLLALVRTAATGEESLARDVGVVLFALLLAALTWRFVEQPVRRSRPGPFATDKGAIITGAAILAACCALAGALWLWAQHRVDADPVLNSAKTAERQVILLAEGCDGDAAAFVQPAPEEACTLGAARAERLVVIWGDSHARHLVPGLADEAAKAGVGLLPMVKGGCRFLLPEPAFPLDAEARKHARCAAFNQAVLAKLAELKTSHGLTGVIVAGHWRMDDGWDAALPQYVRRLQATGLRVVIALDVPTYDYSVPRCVARKGGEACRGAWADVQKRREGQVSTLRRIARETPGVMIWDPAETLCRTGRCEIGAGGEFFYSDANHLSYAGSRYVSGSARPVLDWVAGLDVAKPQSGALAAPGSRSY